MKNLFYIAVASMFACSCANNNELTITVQNQSSLTRSNETVEISWESIAKKFNFKEEQQFILLNQQGQQVPYQLLTNGLEKPQSLIFQTSLMPEQSAAYKVVLGTPEQFANQVMVRFVPERKDDISWENDRVAFRMYGPALEFDPIEPLVSGGIDLWVKKTPELVTERWYNDDLAGVKSYHEDHGEGLDYFSVGKTFGCGAASPFANDSIYSISSNFISYEILDNGPLRSTFRLTYAPYYAADSMMVNETRTISIDAGSNLNKIVENYGDITKDMLFASGFPYYNNEEFAIDAENGYIAYAQPADSLRGTQYTAVVYNSSFVEAKVLDKLMIGVMPYAVANTKKGGVAYYSGGGWSRGGYPTLADWNLYVADFARRLREPLVITLN